MQCGPLRTILCFEVAMNPLAWSFRAQFALGVVLCASLLGYALFVQYGLFLDPCPLCILQRVAFFALGVIFLVGALHSPGALGRKVYGVLASLAAAAGIGIAGRHVWLQSLPPDQVPDCGPGLNYMLETMPFASALNKVLQGSGECAAVDWTFLGFSMPFWSLVWFVGFFVGVLYAGFRSR